MILRLLLVATLCLPGQDRDDVVLTEDFESFDKKNWDDFGAAPEALEIVDGGREMWKSPDGRYWGNSFAPEKPALIECDRWICVEVELKCNTVGGGGSAGAPTRS
jgi:hypothetical protein